jgi:hypothetical protein
MKKRKRTEQLGIEFENGIAKDWAFDMSESFKPSLDIAYMQRADKEANTALKKALGRPLEAAEKMWRMVWTRGIPPAYSFAEGDIFYDPAGVRGMEWEEALKVLRRTVQIIGATPDPEALPLKTSDEEEPRQEEPEPPASMGSGSGWVRYRVFYYEAGEIVREEVGDLRQRDFAEFLRTGEPKI